MYLFENLVFNLDRNAANVLVDADYRLWVVDYMGAFRAVSGLLDERGERIVFY